VLREKEQGFALSPRPDEQIKSWEVGCSAGISDVVRVEIQMQTGHQDTIHASSYGT
jgi:hypothetical protein